MEAYFLIFSFNIFADLGFFFFHGNVEVFSDPVPWKTFLCKNSLHRLKKHTEDTPVAHTCKKKEEEGKRRQTSQHDTRRATASSSQREQRSEHLKGTDALRCPYLVICQSIPKMCMWMHVVIVKDSETKCSSAEDKEPNRHSNLKCVNNGWCRPWHQPPRCVCMYVQHILVLKNIPKGISTVSGMKICWFSHVYITSTNFISACERSFRPLSALNLQ